MLILGSQLQPEALPLSSPFLLVMNSQDFSLVVGEWVSQMVGAVSVLVLLVHFRKSDSAVTE